MLVLAWNFSEAIQVGVVALIWQINAFWMPINDGNNIHLCAEYFFLCVTAVGSSVFVCGVVDGTCHAALFPDSCHFLNSQILLGHKLFPLFKSYALCFNYYRIFFLQSTFWRPHAANRSPLVDTHTTPSHLIWNWWCNISSLLFDTTYWLNIIVILFDACFWHHYFAFLLFIYIKYVYIRMLSP